MVAVAKKPDLAKLVDKLGEVKALIADLEKREELLKNELIAAGVDEVDGDFWHAVVSRYQKSNTDWKKLKAEYHPPRFLAAIEKHTTSKDAVSVRVYSR